MKNVVIKKHSIELPEIYYAYTSTNKLLPSLSKIIFFLIFREKLKWTTKRLKGYVTFANRQGPNFKNQIAMTKHKNAHKFGFVIIAGVRNFDTTSKSFSHRLSKLQFNRL